MNETDTFSFNHAFTCPIKKVKIGTISNKVENREERKETLERIEEERRYQTDVSNFNGGFFFTTDLLSYRPASSAL